MKRYLATFFRGQWLYLAVLLLMLGASGVGTYSLSRSEYQATARIWVDKPTLNAILYPNTPGYTPPPASQHADKLQQLLQTDAFVTAVLKRTSASARLSGVLDQDRKVISGVRKRLQVAVLGPNTVRISYAGADPVLCQEMVQGTIDQFRSWSLASQVQKNAVELQFYQQQLEIHEDQLRDIAGKLAEQNAIELQFYQQQLKVHDEQLKDVSQRLDAFQAQSPRPDATSPQYLELQRLLREFDEAQAQYRATKAKVDTLETLSSRNQQEDFQAQYLRPDPSSPQYLELERLLREFDAAQAQYRATKAKIDQVGLVETLSDRDREIEFEVLDAPAVPQLPTTTLKKMLKYLILGFGASFGLVLGAIVVATWHDPTIRSTDDLRRLSDVPVLQVVPQARTGWKWARKVRETPDTEPAPEQLEHLDGAAD